VHEIHASQVDFESCEGESLSTKCLCCITEESHTFAEGMEEKEFEEIKGEIIELDQVSVGHAAGLLQLAPRTITPLVTGGLGFITSVILCYHVLP
jgi:hypothetical protein